jgi:hypothetical protein
MNHKVAGKKRFARGQDEFNSSVHLAHRNFIWLQKDNFSIPRNRDRISGCFMSLQRFTNGSLAGLGDPVAIPLKNVLVIAF